MECRSLGLAANVVETIPQRDEGNRVEPRLHAGGELYLKQRSLSSSDRTRRQPKDALCTASPLTR
jgi:hypothetical protein